jgi:hypothetical protein
MSATQHTPGPWGISQCWGTGGTDCGFDIEQDESLDYRGAVCHLTDAEHIEGISIAERDANARLISAAPELLAALEDSRLFFAAHADGPGTEAKRLLDQSRAAIAKARGQ